MQKQGDKTKKAIPVKYIVKNISKTPEKKSFFDKIPKEFVPTAKFGWIFIIIFLAVLFVGMFSFFSSIGSLMSGNLDMALEIGYPMTFFSLNLLEVETLPIFFIPLIVDLVLYLLVAYILDVLLNVFIIDVLKITPKENKINKN